jgi:hypothetical protein
VNSDQNSLRKLTTHFKARRTLIQKKAKKMKMMMMNGMMLNNPDRKNEPKKDLLKSKSGTRKNNRKKLSENLDLINKIVLTMIMKQKAESG